MDIQKLFDAMSDNDRRTRSNYHLTLGGLIAALEKAPSDAAVVFDDGHSVGHGDSYRGYYSDFAFGKSTEFRTVESLADYARGVVGQTFDGYKGGEYLMGADTPLWRGEYGCCGPAIIDARMIDGRFTLITKVID